MKILEPETSKAPAVAPAPVEVPAKAKKTAKKAAPVEAPAKKVPAKKVAKVIEAAEETIRILKPDHVFRGQRLIAWNLLKDKMPVLVFLDRCAKAGLTGASGILGKMANVFKVVEVR